MGPGSSPGLRRTGEAAPVLLDFTPVPRRYRHDGWTPERQKAFIEALADTGCVTRAAAQVNIAQTNAYELRRAPGAEEFRRAWSAALDFGLLRLKDIAFERAIEGQLVPVFVGGKLMGFRRKRNDALLMFCLRHYGQDANGKRVTVNYFSTRASAGAVAGTQEKEGPSPASAGAGFSSGRTGGGMAQAEASATTVRTVISGPSGGGPSTGSGQAALGQDEAAAALNGFEGVRLDAEAEAAIAAALEACAARARAADAAYEAGGEAAADAAEDDPEESFVRVEELGDPYRGELLPPMGLEEFIPFVPGEPHWSLAGAEMPPERLAIEAKSAPERGAIEGEGAKKATGKRRNPL
ncbi:MAG TPA: hypothetical protein VEX35_03770 [Allosphingosinicella sp.]|nr:hypothetical protein [Allosphingosinicella sp.]